MAFFRTPTKSILISVIVIAISTVQVIKKCPDVLSVLLGTDSTTIRSTVGTTVHSTVSTHPKKCPYGKQ